MTVLVTGATGNVGAHVLRALRDRGVDARAYVRGSASLDGADRVFLACANVPEQVEFECGLIDAAARAGVSRLVKLSSPAPGVDAPLIFDRWHGEIEAHLDRSGVPAVKLRPSAYMTNVLAYAQTVAQTGRLYAPAGAARISYVDPSDVGAAAAAALLADAPAPTYTLTGPRAITYEEIAEDLSAATGRPIEYLHVPDTLAHQAMLDAGLPAFAADAIIALFAAQRAGMMTCTTDDVRALTGREPRSFAAFATDHAALFGASAPLGVSS